jgi:PncC family amidohydrolase
MEDGTNTPLEALLGELLQQRSWKLAVAESCTGGLIGHRITNIPGSSDYYRGSVTAYAYEAKVRLLNVRWPTLKLYGAVSREVVLEMARGIRVVLEADIGLAVSGIAGPGGATPAKPVGLTWIGLCAPDYERAWQFIFEGDRIANKKSAAEAALQVLIDYLKAG